MLKSLIATTAIVTAIAAPSFAFAQDSSQVTRPEVKADMTQMEQSGYQPEGEHVNYPANAQASENRVEAQRGEEATSYGPVMTGTSASGMRSYSSQPSDHAVYFGH